MKMKPVSVVMGRFQPIHLGHKKIIESMTNPVIVLVKGEKSSQDRSRNPLDADYQKRLIEKISPNAKVIIAPRGYLPSIFYDLREQGMEPTAVYSGDDRRSSYEDQITRYNDKNPESKYDIVFEATQRVTSATDVRNAIRNGDEETFKQLVPEEIHDEWDTLRKLIENSEETRLSFRDWLAEDAVMR